MTAFRIPGGAAVHGEGWLHIALQVRAPRPSWQSSCTLLIGLVHCRVWVLDPSGQIHSHVSSPGARHQISRASEMIRSLISAEARKAEALRARHELFNRALELVAPTGVLKHCEILLRPSERTLDGGEFACHRHGEPVPALRVDRCPSTMYITVEGRGTRDTPRCVARMRILSGNVLCGRPADQHSE